MKSDPKIIMTSNSKIMTSDPKIMTNDPKIMLLYKATNFKITGPKGIFVENPDIRI